MGKKLAIKGHSTRSKEVIELLEMMGGKNCYNLNGLFSEYAYYFIGGPSNDQIRADEYIFDEYAVLQMIDDMCFFTLEEFLEKYPYKILDKVIDKVDGCPGIVYEMKWDEDVSDMKYRVAFDNGDMGWYTNDTIEFLNLENGKTMNKKLAIKGHLTRGNEIIELLEMMGGKNTYGYNGEMESLYFTIYNDAIIYGSYRTLLNDNYVFFTLEEFWEKFPFKVGDKVYIKVDPNANCLGSEKMYGDIESASWVEENGCVAYKLKGYSRIFYREELHSHIDEINMEEKDKAKAPDIKGEDYSGKRFGYKIPDGYEFDVVVDGKIFIKPIKSRYPKTYTECCEILGIGSYFEPEIRNATAEECRKFAELIRLKRCRDAYWKIAGEEMGLGKPWKPDWKNGAETKYTIVYSCSMILNGTTNLENKILAFPTPEMRNAFYDNFKDSIEQCKELL